MNCDYVDVVCVVLWLSHDPRSDVLWKQSHQSQSASAQQDTDKNLKSGKIKKVDRYCWLNSVWIIIKLQHKYLLNTLSTKLLWVGAESQKTIFFVAVNAYAYLAI